MGNTNELAPKGPTKQQLTIRDNLLSQKFRDSIAEILPDHVTPERMARVAIAALSRTPKLKDCTPQSFFRCMMDLSQWGLEPDGRRAHLIPYGKECTLIIDYKGLAELCYRSGSVKRLHADVVHAGDLFKYNKGEIIEHVPYFLRYDDAKPADRGEIIAVYCEARLKDGSEKCELLERDEVEKVRARSRAGSSGPWKTDWSEMAKKTAFRRLSKWLPLSSEVRDAFEKDDENYTLATAPAAEETRKTVDSVEQFKDMFGSDDMLHTVTNEEETE